MSNRDSNGDSDGVDAQLTPIHVTAVLVASVRAMSNALDALGFAEEDNRIVERGDDHLAAAVPLAPCARATR